jgi:hypothetical protein
VTELFGSLPPSGVELLVAWLEPIALAHVPPGDVRGERKAGDPLPFWLVSRVAGLDDKVTDRGTYSVHSMADNMDAAGEFALLAHQRILTLGPPFAPQRRVTISGGREVFADSVTTDLFPRYEYYSDNIRRFVARYDIDLRFIAV